MRILTFAAVIVLTSVAHGQQTMSPEQAAKFEARFRGWAETYYPAITGAKQLPDNLLLGFLVDSKGAVLRHSVGFKTPLPTSSSQVSVTDELSRLFPGISLDQAPHGAACFGGVRAGEPKYCVCYAEQEQEQEQEKEKEKGKAQ